MCVIVCASGCAFKAGRPTCACARASVAYTRCRLCVQQKTKIAWCVPGLIDISRGLTFYMYP